jgi:hypothetical protein
MDVGFGGGGALAQPGDLPVARDYEAKLRERGFVERFLPPRQGTLAPGVADRARGWMLWRRDRNFEVFPNSRPAPGEGIGRLRIVATPGEIESEPFAIYGLRDVASVAVSGVVDGAGGWVKVEDVLFHAVQYPARASRRSGDKTFLRYPVFLRPPSPHPLPAASSRLYWATAAVPETARPGDYQGRIRVADGDGNSVDLTVEVRVLPFRLTDRNLPRFGAFLSGAPFARGEWALMKRYGLDALQWFWGSHAIRIRNEGGRVAMDFSAYDAFVKGMQDAGMRGPIVLSLGNSWLGHYEIRLAEAFGLRLMRRALEGRMVTLMDMTDPRWEKPYIEGLRLIFEHAKAARWPPLALLINDEPTKHIMAFYPYRYHLIKKHFPDIPVYGVFFQPEKDPGPLLHSSDIVVANRDLERTSRLARDFGKRFWTYNNVTADESFGKIRLLYGQIPAYYESEVMFFWCWNYWVGSAWDDFDGRGERDGPAQSDADWVAVYPSVDGVEPVRTLAVEAAREAIDDVRYLKTLEQMASARDAYRWSALRAEIRRRQKAMLDGIALDNRIYSDADFFVTARNDDVEKLRAFLIEEILKLVR